MYHINYNVTYVNTMYFVYCYSVLVSALYLLTLTSIYIHTLHTYIL